MGGDRLQQSRLRNGLSQALSEASRCAHFRAEHTEAQNSGRARAQDQTAAKEQVKESSSWDLQGAHWEAGRMHGTETIKYHIL